MRENRTYGSEGGEGESLSLPLSYQNLFGASLTIAIRHKQYSFVRC